MPKFMITTLGCKVNQAESEAIVRQLMGPEWQPVLLSEDADVCVINTCTVTQKAAMQSRQAVRRAIHANPQACVVVTGCCAATDAQALAKIQGLDYIVEPSGKERLPEILRNCGARKCARPAVFSMPPHGSPLAADGSSPVAGNRTRPFLKIQDGCDAFCTYCIVPYARGRSRSVAFQAVLDRIALLSDQGYHETVLTGIHLGHYGIDLDPPSSLLDLLQAIESHESPIRVRLSSIEPLELVDGIIELAARSERFCRHFHIPLQSGDAGILKKMGRPYSPGLFAGLVEKIHRLLPDAAIGADVLVGFPGETDTAFENTYRLIERLPVSYLHVFPFSARPGTAAYHLPEKVPSNRIKEQCRRLRQLGSQKRLAFHRSFIGKSVEVLVEARRDLKTDLLKGISSNYLPVLFEGGDKLMNQEAELRIYEVVSDRLRGVLAKLED
jgi:threonylcarbamoyladenosine tRNA methylthiotransferase MtaB